MNPQKLYSIFRRPVGWTEIDYHHPVLVVLNQVRQRCYQLYPPLGSKIASKYRIMKRISEPLHRLMDLLKPFWVHYIIAYHVPISSPQATHLVTKAGYSFISPLMTLAKSRA